MAKSGAATETTATAAAATAAEATAAAAKKQATHRISCQFVNGPPVDEGNYVVFDVLTTEEYVAMVHRHTKDGKLHVFSGKHRRDMPLTEMLTNQQRWFLLGELAPSSVRELTMTPIKIVAD